MSQEINKDTKLCISLASRPGNFGTQFQNFLYRELKLNFELYTGVVPPENLVKKAAEFARTYQPLQ